MFLLRQLTLSSFQDGTRVKKKVIKRGWGAGNNPNVTQKGRLHAFE